MNAASLLLIALGGALGSVARALVAAALPAGRFPWATLLVNAVGSFAIGWVMVRLGALEAVQEARTQAFVVVGFCGGFTTFSTFSWQTVDQMMRGQWGAAASNIVLSLALCLLATWLGLRLGRA